MKKINHSLKESVNGITPLPDIKRTLLKREFCEQPNPSSDEYEKDFLNSSIEG